MNTETGQIKRLEDLTEEEKKSGKWIEMKGLAGVEFPPSVPLSKSDLKREAYMQRVKDRLKAIEESCPDAIKSSPKE